MQQQHTVCYLRRERRTWALTQEELASLFGMISHAQISRVEKEKRPPSAHLLIASEVLFGMPAQELFPTFYSEIEEGVLAHASMFLDSIEITLGLDADKKRDLLSTLLARALTRLNTEPSL